MSLMMAGPSFAGMTTARSATTTSAAIRRQSWKIGSLLLMTTIISIPVVDCPESTIANMRNMQEGAIFLLHLLWGVGALELRRAAVATGGSTWHLAARMQQPCEVQVRCSCGGLWLSKAHAVWACKATQHCRVGLAPRVLKNDCLLLLHSPRFQQLCHVAFITPASWRARPTTLQRGDAVLVATDGNSRHGVGGFAIVYRRWVRGSNASQARAPSVPLAAP